MASLLHGPVGLAADLHELQGAVYDDEKLPLKGAEIILVDANSRALVKSLLSDAAGQYRFKVKSGTYELRYRKANYTSKDIKGIAVATPTQLDTVQLMSREWDIDGAQAASGGSAGSDCE